MQGKEGEKKEKDKRARRCQEAAEEAAVTKHTKVHRKTERGYTLDNEQKGALDIARPAINV